MGRLHELANGIWTLDGDPISFLTFPYQIRSTIVDLGRGDLLLHSPVQIAAVGEVGTLSGEIKYIVSPNKLHHKFLGEWKSAFPKAKVYAPPGLRTKRPDLQFDKDLADNPEPEWAGVLNQKIVHGSFFMSEVVFFHKPSETLILGDLIENHDPQVFGVVHRAIASANAMLAPKGSTPRNYRWTFLRRMETKQDLREILGWHPKRVVMAHGPIVEVQTQEFLQRAFRWAI